MLPLAKAPCQDRSSQQKTFDAFRAEYNNERPHEALCQTTPASHYVKSPRPMPPHMPEPDYAPEAAVRKVRSNGEIKWKGGLVYVSQSLIGEAVAIEETDQGEWALRFFGHKIGALDDCHNRLRRRTVLPLKEQNSAAQTG